MEQLPPFFYRVLSLFEFLAADFVSRAVNIESIGRADVIEDDFTAAVYRKCERTVFKGRFCKRTAR